MPIYSDNIGNKFLGDCVWSNHDPSYPGVEFLNALPHSNLSAELTSLCSAAGLLYRDIRTQGSIDANSGAPLINFGAIGDIDDRYAFAHNAFYGGGSNSIFSWVYLANNSGTTFTQDTPITSTTTTTNILAKLSQTSVNTGAIRGLEWVSGSTYSPPVWAGVCDGYSLGLFNYQHILNQNRPKAYHYLYAGQLEDLNTDYADYGSSVINRSIIISGYYATLDTTYLNSRTFSMLLAHYIGSTAKLCLTSGVAQFEISCLDGQTPSSQWATHLHVFDNDGSRGFPRIGRVRNMLLASGFYQIGQPVRISGDSLPDAGNNWWLPVGMFAGKTALMRCYSSSV
jgi:hypothetical protein